MDGRAVELFDFAAPVIETGRCLIFGLGANDNAGNAFARAHGELFAACT